MKKPLFALVALAVLVVAVYLAIRASRPHPPATGAPGQVAQTATEFPEPPPGAVVFNLTYRGLDAPDDPLSYRAYWGWGRDVDENEPFVQAVTSRVKECTPVYNGSLPSSQWSVVELQDGKPVALWFDTDADGKAAEKERFPLAAPSGSDFGYECAFITCDFTMRTEDQREVPFRVLLVGNSYGSDRVSYMWSPCCVLEGQATLAGKPMKLLLYANGFSGSFTTFGGSAFALLPAAQKPQEYISRSTLSRLILHEGTFYRTTLYGTHEKGKTVRLVLEKDTTPTGRMAVELKGKDPLKARFTGATINGATDDSIYFHMSGDEFTLPAGSYRLASAYVRYGVQGDGDWQASLNAGPDFDIKAGETSGVALGELKLVVGAVDEKERYNSDAKERATYTQGTPIYLTPRIKGAAGEVYTRFSQIDAGSGNRTDIKPHITIVDRDGKQIASTDLEYG